MPIVVGAAHMPEAKAPMRSEILMSAGMVQLPKTAHLDSAEGTSGRLWQLCTLLRDPQKESRQIL